MTGRFLMRRIGGLACVLVAPVSPALKVGFPPPGGHFDVGVQPNLPQPLRNNKTVGLVAWEGTDADGD
ncbi:hypothetical protein BN1232_05005 [Mycobacterium lentiflavum]|uniref:Uncharacterized protein n=1 Tax=Mycobacterium lentiflavum TaxID=141349 RepID=A0A0E3WDN2_MYCLN|nr:hypothetical protein BN1232_05005 [Mycobacterium lentiflavum]